LFVVNVAACRGGLGYLVAPSIAMAQKAYQEVLTHLQQANPQNALPGGEVYPRLGWTTFYYEVVDNVVIAGFYDRAGQTDFAESRAYELVEAGRIHLQRVIKEMKQ
jgi:hypothetical protein